MKTVNANYEILELPEATDKLGVLKHIERIGRVCYKSEDKITDESCIKFIEMLKNRKHWAMLEHYIFVLAVPFEVYVNVTDQELLLYDDSNYNNAMKFVNSTYSVVPDSEITEKYPCLISLSFTALNNIIQCEVCKDLGPDDGIIKVWKFFHDHYPEAVIDFSINNDLYDEEIDIDTDRIKFLTREEIKSLPLNLRLIHDSASVKFTTDRGVTHELVRHRPASYAQESTRYCNYHSDKFDNNITFLDPLFFKGRDELYNEWVAAVEDAEKHYNKLIELGAVAQEARSILPHSTKVDILMTARMCELVHFFKMRVPATGHPQMREITIPLFEEMHSREKEIFDELYYELYPTNKGE